MCARAPRKLPAPPHRAHFCGRSNCSHSGGLGSSGSPSSQTPSYSDLSSLPPWKSGNVGTITGNLWPVCLSDRADFVGCSVMDIMGVLPTSPSPETLCLGCSPLGPQGADGPGTRGDSWGTLETSISVCSRGWPRRGCRGAVRDKGLSTPMEVTTRGLTVRASSPRGLLDLGGDTASTGALGGTSGSPGFLA